MIASTLRITFSLLLHSLPGVTCQYLNLPDVPPGVFTVGTSLEIASNKSAAWAALTNFPDYADWNPFVRAAIVTTPNNLSLPNQYPVETANLYLRTQTPPLPLPVNRYTLENPLNVNFAYEDITHVQPDLGRLAWKYIGDEESLAAERWQGVLDLENGKVLYESREVFHGTLAEVLKDLLGEGLQAGFEAQAQGLKLWLER
ncbi:hypothetical protein BDV95DRAFT_558101 [Massariosphaeria phaeospora]|uniref:Coenzyme Q-binding protein COQ10 START domain-containing protein n=1 Tax=Massariosphaeria phaeospora TaxID=100035 RepID=A0A7C8MI58_9PLEO|nr:hypothetical protein BDV95DRAFT_558101 [Massariosphaeria phaeospora]